MARKKKENIEVNNNDTNEFVYCGWRNCNPDKDWNCKDMEV